MNAMQRVLVGVGIVLALLWSGGCQKDVSKEKKGGVQKMTSVKVYKPKDYSHLIGIQGFSDEALKLHFALYEGYVKNTNKLLENMKALLDRGEANTPEFAELKRRFGFEFDGMKLHELFFENLGGSGEPLNPDSPLYKMVVANFGSLENWQKEFVATGSMRGIGWVVLCYDQEAGRLLNAWVNEHHTGLLAGCKALLVMDVFEHAYILDYRLDRLSYIDSFFKNVDWKVVEGRFEGKEVPEGAPKQTESKHQ